MGIMGSSLLIKIAIWAVPVLFSIIIHEVAHGWMAHRLGDCTAKDMGRLTLNPASHIDIIGTIVLPLMMLILGGPVFGWAKPVPFNPNNFHRNVDIRKGTMLVALAGPGSNLIIAFFFSFLFIFVLKFFSSFPHIIFISLSQLTQALIYINLLLCCFNLIPIPPLDGSKILMGLLPTKYYNFFLMLERYGFIIIIILLASGAFSNLIFGPVNFLFKVFLSIPLFLIN